MSEENRPFITGEKVALGILAVGATVVVAKKAYDTAKQAGEALEATHRLAYEVGRAKADYDRRQQGG